MTSSKVTTKLVAIPDLVAFVRTHPNLVFLWHYGRHFRAITGECRLTALNNFIRGTSVAETGLLSTRFRFRNFSVTDERGLVINDFL